MTRGPQRNAAIDAARGAAVLMMFVAHVAPSDGPLRILITAEFLTAPLFAMLMGVGAELAQERHPRRPWAPELVRAACLFAVGWALSQSRAQVVVVLMHLAVLSVICVPLSRLRTLPLVGVGVASVAAALALPRLFIAGWHPELTGPLGGYGPYRLAAFVLYAVAGMLLMRALRTPWAERSSNVWLACCAALAVMGVLLIGTNILGIVEVHAYDGTIPETLGNLAGSVGLILLMWAVLEVGPGRRLPRRIRSWLSAPGQMSLSLYTLQILILHVFEVRTHDARDDSWTMLLLLMGAALALTAVWRVLAGLPWAKWWPSELQRGPLEGLIGAMESLVR